FLLTPTFPITRIGANFLRHSSARQAWLVNKTEKRRGLTRPVGLRRLSFSSEERSVVCPASPFVPVCSSASRLSCSSPLAPSFTRKSLFRLPAKVVAPTHHPNLSP